MTKTSIDISKLRQCGEDILSETDSYIKNINGLFELINNVPTKTKEWTGVGAERYAEAVYKNEKINYDNYGSELKKLGQSLIDYADDLDSIIEYNKIGSDHFGVYKI